MNEKRIFISAGEASGEMHAARLAEALRARTGAHLFGLGGARMREAGVELVEDASRVSVVGISEVIERLPAIWRAFRRLTDEVARRRPQLAILVDFPDFHLRLAQRLHRQGVRIVYFISPQVWAWRPGRIRLMKRLVERVLCIFPFEEKLYRDAGVPADFVGHPLADAVRVRRTRAEFAARHEIDPQGRIVALLPGSRPSEIAHHLPVMLDACARLGGEAPAAFVLAPGPGITERMLAAHARSHLPVYLAVDETYDTLAAADCAIVCSGTATVEAALLGTPMVVVYRVSPATALLVRRLVEVPHFAMVNLIAGRRIVPELMQKDFTPEGVAREVRRLLDEPEAREQQKRDLAEVRAKLGPGGAVERAAEIIASMM